MASLGKKMKTDCRILITETITEIETEIKAAVYDITKGAKDQAITTLERVRRKLKVLEEKTKLNLKSLDLETAKTKDQMHSLSLKEKNLLKENLELKKKVKDLDMLEEKIKADEFDSFLLSQKENLEFNSQGDHDVGSQNQDTELPGCSSQH